MHGTTANLSPQSPTEPASTLSSTGSESTQSSVAPALAAASAFAIPLALSVSTSPSPQHPQVLAWYKSLRQPFFKPPDWAVPLAWAGIEAGLAMAAYRLVRAAPSAARTRALVTLGFNITMIGAWSRLFFGRRALATSTVAASAMVATGLVFVRQARRVDPVAARAGIPFVAWVGFATVLTGAIWGLNRRR